MAAGCGNYGNLAIDDSIYLNALPTAQDLRYSVPKDPAAPLCVLGESKTARDTFNLGTGLEQEVEGILKIIEFIKAQPPTSRDATSRTWGPWPDGQHAGTWDRVKMVRSSDTHFSFALDQAASVSGTYLTVLSADLLGSVATRGSGTLTFDYSASAALGTNKSSDPTSGFLDIKYDAASEPRTIDIANRQVAPPVKFSVAAYADGQMQIAFDFTDASGAHFFGTSKFLGNGGGASQVRLEKGQFGDTIGECWDPSYCRGYLNDPAGWSNPPCTSAFCVLGSLSACPSVHGGLPFP